MLFETRNESATVFSKFIIKQANASGYLAITVMFLKADYQ